MFPENWLFLPIKTEKSPRLAVWVWYLKSCLNKTQSNTWVRIPLPVVKKETFQFQSKTREIFSPARRRILWYGSALPESWDPRRWSRRGRSRWTGSTGDLVNLCHFIRYFVYLLFQQIWKWYYIYAFICYPRINGIWNHFDHLN